jgi:hypothetical protein
VIAINGPAQIAVETSSVSPESDMEPANGHTKINPRVESGPGTVRLTVRERRVVLDPNSVRCFHNPVSFTATPCAFSVFN